MSRMIRYIQTMMRNEPITFAVMLVMIGLLAFGGWNALPQPKKVSDRQAGTLIAAIGPVQAAPVA